MKDKNFIRRFMDSVSGKVTITILILVLPLNILAFFSANRAMNKVEEYAVLVEQNIADSYMMDVAVKMDNTLSLLYYLQTEDSSSIRMMLQPEDDYQYMSAKMKCFYTTKHMAKLISGGDGYFYYLKKKEDFMIYNGSEEEAIFLTWLQAHVRESTRNDSKIGWQLVECEGLPYLLLQIDSNQYTYGGWVALDPIIRQIGQSVFYDNSQIFFSRRSEVCDEKKIGVSAGYNKIYLNIHVDRMTILREIAQYELMLLILALSYLPLLPILYLWLRRLVIKPLNRINEGHRQLQQGNESYRIRHQKESLEYQEAYEYFNQMADNIVSLRIKAYEKEIERQQMELTNLQLQIRPHFLLNTFNLIFNLAQRGEYKTVQESIIYLSDYFRYVFRSSNELMLFQKELFLLEGYGKLSSVRYPGQVEFTFYFEPEIMMVRIPQLLLLNFVENAVKHGLNNGHVLHITVSGEYESGKVSFFIIDDGKGLVPDVLLQYQKMFRGEWVPEDTSSHVGLYNSLKRLRYFYGEQASITLEQQEAMTAFCIQFPYYLEVEDEFINGQ